MVKRKKVDILRLANAVDGYIASIKALKKEMDICNWHDTEGIHCNSADLIPFIANNNFAVMVKAFDPQDTVNSWVKVSIFVAGTELFCLIGIDTVLEYGFFESEHEYYAFMGGFDDGREGC